MSSTTAAYDEPELMRRQGASQRAFHRALAATSPGAFGVELGGDIQATVVPAVPRVALVNSVFYGEPAALRSALAEIADAYRRAGVAHWGVWVPAEDRATAQMLREAGHTRRMAPMVMGGPLRGARTDGDVAIELDEHATAAMVGRCNDIAFGVRPPDTLAAAFESDDGASGLRAYVARRGGELACGLIVRHDGENLYTWGLAATPAARGSLLAIRLMRVVIADARRAGCVTVTCETTPAAQTIAQYMRLRPVGRLALWERRSA